MKKLLLILSLAFAFTSFAYRTEAQCDGQRYYSLIYPTYDSSTVVYSNNNMTMDIYSPHGDTATKRKAILVIHGGDFYQGTSRDPFPYFLCQQYTQRGYVVASINYSEITPTQIIQGALLDSTTFYPIFAQTVSEGKAALRYLKMQSTSLNIDSSWIVITGESSGAFIADHIAYMKGDAGITPLLDSAFAPLGGLDGNSGNPGYSTKVKAVLNFGGAMLNLDMLTHLDNEPCYTFQGDSDANIPFECDYMFDKYTDFTVCGGGAMQPVLSALGTRNQLLTFDSLDASPWLDTVYSGLLQGQHIEPMVDSQAALFLYQIDCPQYLGVKVVSDTHIRLFPNPASNDILIKSDEVIESVSIIDYTGRLVKNVSSSGQSQQIDISTLPPGLYLARINLRNNNIAVRTFVRE